LHPLHTTKRSFRIQIRHFGHFYYHPQPCSAVKLLYPPVPVFLRLHHMTTQFTGSSTYIFISAICHYYITVSNCNITTRMNKHVKVQHKDFHVINAVCITGLRN
jgi:hypothetical protein